MAKTQAPLKTQVLGVCRLYYSQVWNEALKQARVKASFDLWKVENVYYPPAIRETAPASSEAKVALEEAEAARPKAALAITAHNEPVEESELPRATEAHKNLNPKAPQKTTESTADAQAPHVEEPAFSIQPLQTVPLSEGSKGPEVTPTQLPKEGVKIKLKK